MTSKLTRDQIAEMVAADIPPGSYVNLGIGQPTQVAGYLRPADGVVLHTENGMLGMGPAATGAAVDEDLINAGKQYVTETPGAAYFHHADSFAMMRGGDLANWHTGEPGAIPAVGGAMDLAIGAKDVFVMMTLFAKDGSSKLRPECTYPLTGLGCVSRIYTDYAVFELDRRGGVRATRTFGIGLADLGARVGLDLG